MEAAQADVLQQFLAITGADEAAAIGVLQATDWQLEAAVELHFATAGEGGAGLGGFADPGAASGAVPSPGAMNQAMPPSLMEEDEIRAPIPAKMDTLYGDMGAYGLPRARYGGPAAANLLSPGPEHVDAFRDFAAEAAAGSAGVNSQPRGRGGAGSSSNSMGQPPSGPGVAKLSDMFKPPKDLLYLGTFDQAKEDAGKQGRWLLINVQQNDEFGSHQLNRDTWSQLHVQEIVKGMFIFWQAYDTAPEGQKVVAAYHLHQFPAILIVDPITGALMYEHTGFMSPDFLLEQLVPFMDAGPNDPGAGALAQAAMRRRAAGAHAKAAASGRAGGGSSKRVEAMTEDEQLALALAMSSEAAAGSPAAAAGAGSPGYSGVLDEDDEDDAEEEAELWRELERRRAADAAAAAAGSNPPPGEPAAAEPAAAAVDPAAAAVAAAARLPAEPEAGAAGSCRVAVRLPDGGRQQRRFLEADTVGVLQDWVRSLVPEAAAGRPFGLSEGFPGAPVLGADAAEQQLKQAGAANAMLVFRWLDS